jgi:hypothetical protein
LTTYFVCQSYDSRISEHINRSLVLQLLTTTTISFSRWRKKTRALYICMHNLVVRRKVEGADAYCACFVKCCSSLVFKVSNVLTAFFSFPTLSLLCQFSKGTTTTECEILFKIRISCACTCKTSNQVLSEYEPLNKKFTHMKTLVRYRGNLDGG